jgi:hypothetical protein
VGADVVEGMAVVGGRVVTELVVVDATTVGIVAVKGSVPQEARSPNATAESKASHQRKPEGVIVQV